MAQVADELWAHCRLPLPSRPLREELDGVSIGFCCVGCITVFRLIGSAGERGSASWFLAKLGLAAILSGNVMMFQSLDVLIRGGSREAFRAPRWVAAILLGALQGFLPCALVYAAASRAAFAGSPRGGALIMFVFGLGTVPAIFTISSVSSTISRVRPWRWAGAFVLVVAALLILRGTAALGIVPHTIFW